MQDVISLTQSLKTASLDDILQQIRKQVKTHPQDVRAREALFKLYCVDGVWDKALLQLQTLALVDEGVQKQSELYKNLVFSEMQRQQVLAGERQAATLHGEMPAWMAALHQANAAFSLRNVEQAETIRAEAFDLAPESAGQSDTLGAFSWIADSDSRLGPVCEFICAGGYRWLPWSSIEQLTVSAPGDLLDLLWLPTTIKVQGETWYGYIPARYPVGNDDDQDCKLGLTTRWQAQSDLLSIGYGRKVLITDISEQAITEVGDIVFG